MEPKFNVDEWLKTIDIWDQKYDYVMHDDHWLTTSWCPSCQKCRVKGKPRAPITITSSPVKQNPIQANTNHLKLTTTVENDNNNHNNYKEAPSSIVAVAAATAALSPPQASMLPPPESIIPVTPIAPSHISNRAFVTPKTTAKFNDTYTRSTRQSTKKLLNQTKNHQDLINLNETFDLYKSALAETPEVEGHQTNDASDDKQQLLDLASTTVTTITDNTNSATITKNGHSQANMLTSTLLNYGNGNMPSKPHSNFELLTNNHNNGNHDLNQVSLHADVDNHNEYAQPVTSRIPRIPVRSSRNHDY